MSTVTEHGPNADIVHYAATRIDDHRRAWKAVARSAQQDINDALSLLEVEALAIFRADDRRPGRWRRLPPNLGHLLALVVGAAESDIAAAELDLQQARKHLHLQGGNES